MADALIPRLIATDLDGTLVRSDDTVSAYTHEVMTRVAATGVPSQSSARDGGATPGEPLRAKETRA